MVPMTHAGGRTPSAHVRRAAAAGGDRQSRALPPRGRGDGGREVGAGRVGGMGPIWMLDELRSAGAEHLDPGFVAGFDRKQGFPDVEVDLEVLRQRSAW